MKQKLSLLAPLGLLTVTACAQQREAIDRVQPDYQHKSFYVGEDLVSIADDPEFYMRGTLIDVGYGASQDGLFSSTYAQPVNRIKWEITESFLNARLAYERIEGSDSKGNPIKGMGFKTANDGLIVASYEIKSHFDIQQAYNETTGELKNLVEENIIDRPWYEREYIRVDWSQNHATNNYEYDTLSMIGIYGGVNYEPLADTVLDPNNEDAPFFSAAGDYFDITNKYFATPGEIDLSSLGWGIDSFPTCWLPDEFFGGTWPDAMCSPVELTIRNSFRKVEDADYEPFNTDGWRFQAFGIFDQQRFGYNRQYGVLDTKWYRFAARYNIWERSHYYASPETMTGAVPCNTEATTEFGIEYHSGDAVGVTNDPNADPNRDGNEDGTADECEAVTAATGMGGSQCDIFKNKCTLPYRLRETKTIPWHINYLTDDDDIFHTTDWATQEWDLAMKSAVQVSRLVECYRTSSSGGQAACKESFPMWTGQQDATDDAIRLTRELTHCYRQNGWYATQCVQELGSRARQYADEVGNNKEHDAIVAVIELDPILVLCHNPVQADDHEACGVAGTQARRGDLRFHAVNIIDAPQTPSPWGIMVNGVDPYWGEHVATSVNLWDHVTNLAAQGLIDEIRYTNGELPTEMVTSGEYVRRHDQTQAIARSPTLNRDDINRRLAAATDLTGQELAQLMEDGVPSGIREAMHQVKAEHFDTATRAGVPSQTRAVAAARMRAARGSLVEAELLNPAMQQLAGIPADLPLEGPIAQRASPFALNNPLVASDMRRRMHDALAERGACMLQDAPEPTSLSGLAPILEAKFPTADDETESEKKDRYDRMLRYVRSRLNYGVIAHEMGHAVGHRHNFVSSSDALFYRPQYWQLRTKNGTVTTVCTDAVDDGEDCVGPRYFDPVTDEEQSQLIWMFQNSSVMDYAGDVSQDMLGLGAWDFAATRFFYGDNVPVYDSLQHKAGTAIGVGLTNATDTFGGLFGIKFTIDEGGAYGPTNFHYSELNNKYGVIWGCHDVTPRVPSFWDEEVDGVWNQVLDGHIVSVDGQPTKCRQMSVDYAGWTDLRPPEPDEIGGGYYRGGPSVDDQKRVRVPYGFASDHWADLGNASVYRHDNGADAYEIASFLINKQENRHIFDNFRRLRTNFSVRKAANRAFERYNEKLLGLASGVGFFSGIYKNFATNIGFPYNELWPFIVGGDDIRDNMVAATLVFDHFVRQLSRPEDGPHFKMAAMYNDKVLRSVKDADGNAGSTAVVIPNGSTGYLKDIGFGGQPLENE